VFFLVFGRIVHLKLSSLGKWSSLRVVGEIFLARSFTFFNLILEARSALPRQLLTDTRPLAAFFVVFLPCRRKIRLCWSLVIGAWCPSAWGLSAVWCACRPRAAFFFFFFSGRSHQQPVIWRWTSVWVAPVSAREGPSDFLAHFLHCRQLVLGGFCFSVVCFFSFFLGHSLLVLSSNFMGIFVG
jgi:hypothetical protein